jgi:CheY-like chemotaxis protein
MKQLFFFWISKKSHLCPICNLKETLWLLPITETNKMHILLVDDDPTFRNLAAANLRARDLTDLTIAHSAEEALEMVVQRRVPFDCYLLDITLGGMDGIELCSRLRHRPEARSAPIIMITSGRSGMLMERAFDAGATDFLRKPLDETELAGRIRTAMMLVDATRRERRGRSALNALMSVAPSLEAGTFGEHVCFADVDGMLQYHEFENRLLRMKDGPYQIGVFRIDLLDFRKDALRCDRSDMLQRLLDVGTRISGLVSARRLMLSYIGRGRFICCVIGRQSRLSGLFQTRLQQSAGDALLALSEGPETNLAVTSLSGQPIMPREEVIALVRAEYEAATESQVGDLPEIDVIEDNIFAKTREFEHNMFSED